MLQFIQSVFTSISSKKGIGVFVIVLILLLLNSTVCFSTEQSQREIDFILAEEAGFKFDFAKIYNPEERLLVLIIGKDALVKFNDNQKKYLSDFIMSSDFSAQNIATLCQNVLNKYGIIDLKKIHFSTIDEGLVSIVDDVRVILGIKQKPEELIRFRDKTIMKQHMKQNMIVIPKYTHFSPKRLLQEKDAYINEVFALLGPKIVAKPIDGKGSIGVQFLNSKQDLLDWAKNHSQYNNYELDEYIEGSLYHGDSIIKNGRIIATIVSEYAFPVAEFLHGKILGSFMLQRDTTDHDHIKNMTERSLQALAPLPDGVMHTEIFKKFNGELVFLETAYRPAGASVPEVYEKCMNVNLQYVHTALQLNMDIEISPQITCYAGFIWFPMQEGWLTQILDKPNILSHYTEKWKVKLGTKLQNPTSMRDRVVEYVIWNEEFGKMYDDFRYMSDNYMPFVTSKNASIGN